MNILFLTQRVPYPPNRGDKLRAFNEIKLLARNYRIFLTCLADDERDVAHKAALSEFCASVDIVYNPPLLANMRALAHLISTKPLTLPFFSSNRLRQIVRQKIEKERIDVLFAYCSSMAQYIDRVPHLPKIIDFVDVDSEKWAQYAKRSRVPRSWVYAAESRRLRKYERWLAENFQHSIFVSEQEKRDFQRLVCDVPTLTALPNGVDRGQFYPSATLPDSNTLIFTGAMDYFANIETVIYFTRNILPKIRESVPDVVFYIVGSHPTEEVVQLGRDDPKIIVTGFVESVLPYMHKATAFVAPMRIARGLQNKILEAMASGVPVVTNTLGFEGISAVPGQDILVEDKPEAFAQKVIRLMQEPDLRNSLARKGLQVIEKHYIWENNLERLEYIIHSTNL
ncbi:glycosyl transferase, group I [Candidatus Moduliflexus flocculans]|uniref:Glycosyl transferase, group I n=1 Tax=Candidatus Moduliflexus flocculans TaxID=1499966 RepID=A0A081BM04_9BACT|nr:glycosyl transferase, group I [Candidatus Moduliflexus flocculans]